jgi:hypothetical protein
VVETWGSCGREPLEKGVPSEQTSHEGQECAELSIPPTTQVAGTGFGDGNGSCGGGDQELTRRRSRSVGRDGQVGDGKPASDAVRVEDGHGARDLAVGRANGTLFAAAAWDDAADGGGSINVAHAVIDMGPRTAQQLGYAIDTQAVAGDAYLGASCQLRIRDFLVDCVGRHCCHRGADDKTREPQEPVL